MPLYCSLHTFYSSDYDFILLNSGNIWSSVISTPLKHAPLPNSCIKLPRFARETNSQNQAQKQVEGKSHLGKDGILHEPATPQEHQTIEPAMEITIVIRETVQVNPQGPIRAKT